MPICALLFVTQASVGDGMLLRDSFTDRTVVRTRAVTEVYKLLDDPIAQRHAVLQKYCLQVLGRSSSKVWLHCSLFTDVVNIIRQGKA